MAQQEAALSRTGTGVWLVGAWEHLGLPPGQHGEARGVRAGILGWRPALATPPTSTCPLMGRCHVPAHTEYHADFGNA